MALLVIEIDRFGILDDSHGQSFRDDLVRNIASIVSQNGRQGDTAAQYGSKEFALVLPETNTADAYCLAESIREEIEGTCLLAGLPPKAAWVTVSIGLATVSARRQIAGANCLRQPSPECWKLSATAETGWSFTPSWN